MISHLNQFYISYLGLFDQQFISVFLFLIIDQMINTKFLDLDISSVFPILFFSSPDVVRVFSQTETLFLKIRISILGQNQV